MYDDGVIALASSFDALFDNLAIEQEVGVNLIDIPSASPFDPIIELGRPLWATGIDVRREIMRDRLGPIGAAVVDDYQLEIRVGLSPHRLEASTNKRLRILGRDNYGHQRVFIGKSRYGSRFQHHRPIGPRATNKVRQWRRAPPPGHKRSCVLPEGHRREPSRLVNSRRLPALS